MKRIIHSAYWCVSLCLLLMGCSHSNEDAMQKKVDDLEAKVQTLEKEKATTSAPTASTAQPVTENKTPQPVTENKNNYIPVQQRKAYLPTIPLEQQFLKVLDHQKMIADYPVTMWTEDKEQSPPLPVQFGSIKGNLFIAQGHPNGVMMYVTYQDQGNEKKISLPYDFKDLSGKPIIDFIGLKESNPPFKVQATAYDFDQDGKDEIIVVVGNKATDSAVNVFSFKNVDDPHFNLELSCGGQSQVWIDGKEVQTPIGSHDGWTYLWTDKGFYKKDLER